MKSIIIDDDVMSQSLLATMCDQVDSITLAKICTTATEAIQFLRHETVDLIFLDIEMPGMNGFDLLGTLTVHPQVIVTSAKSEYAIEAFGFQVTDFIQKPIPYARFIRAIERAFQLKPKNSQSMLDEIYVRADGRLIRLLLNDINYIESLGDYVIFHTIRKEKIIAHSTMKNIEEKINSSRFVRVHRSFIVNLAKVVDIQDQNMVVSDRTIPISKAHKNSLFNLIQTI
jgi:DNA-binding LytR/AlgR family response regulator